MHHLFRSKELITLLNRFGHCENYSFTLELEAAIAKISQLQSSVLSKQIIRHPVGLSVFHSEFDNFDQLINDISGRGSVHTAHGIMLQDLSVEQREQHLELPLLQKGRKRSLSESYDEELEECYVTQRKSPSIQINRQVLPGSVEASKTALTRDTAWLILRMIDATHSQIPGW